MTLVRRLFRSDAPVAYDDTEVSVHGLTFERTDPAVRCSECGRTFTDADETIDHAAAGHLFVIVLDEDTPAAFVVSELFPTLEAAKAYEAEYLANDRARRILPIAGRA